MAYTKRIVNTVHSYGWGFILIHWLMAMLIIGLYPLGLYIDTLSYYDAAYRTVPHIHKSIGALVFFALVVRLCWRLLNPAPAALPQPALQDWATRIAHLLLYLLMLVALLSGYLISTADGRPLEVFNWLSLPALVTGIDNLEDIAGSIHWYTTTALIALAALHALAALKHHFINRDSTLKRIFGITQETP